MCEVLLGLRDVQVLRFTGKYVMRWIADRTVQLCFGLYSVCFVCHEHFVWGTETVLTCHVAAVCQYLKL